MAYFTCVALWIYLLKIIISVAFSDMLTYGLVIIVSPSPPLSPFFFFIILRLLAGATLCVCFNCLLHGLLVLALLHSALDPCFAYLSIDWLLIC